MTRNYLTSILMSIAALACGAPDSTESQALETSQTVSQALIASGDLRASVDLQDAASRALGADAALNAAGQRMASASCVQIELLGTRLSLDFGTGCTLHGTTYSGQVVVQASASSSNLGFDLTLTSFSNSQATYDGTGSFDAGPGQTATALSLLVTEAGQSRHVDYVGNSGSDPQGQQYTGSGSIDEGGAVSSFDAQGLHHSPGDCYPDAGTLVLSTVGTPDITVTFSATTPITGEVSLQVGRLPAQTYVLPGYGQCP